MSSWPGVALAETGPGHPIFAPAQNFSIVMPGQKRVFSPPGIHTLLGRGKEDVDGRDEPGHDGGPNGRSITEY
jgi:hypothetical protein